MHRRGLALVTVFWWIAAASTVLTLSFAWTMQKARWGATIQKATDQLYLAEGILAGEINRLKSRPWLQRWYRPDGAPARPGGALVGKPIQGVFEGASYTGFVQDVLDPWSAGGIPGARILANHSDLFLKVKYPDETIRSFFHRVVFRHPNSERPTTAVCRRFAEVPEHDLEDVASRRQVVAGIDKDEMLRERRRAESNVYERELSELDRDNARPGELWQKLTQVRGLDAQIQHEREVVSLLRTGQRYLTDPAALGTPGRIGLAREAFNAALRIAEQTADAANVQASIPRCLYAAGRGEWMYARTLARDGAEGVERAVTIQGARRLFERIVDRFPWRGVPPVPPGRSFPSRLEAPHAYVAIAFTLVNEANPDNPAEYNAAVDQAILQLEKLRQDYPDFHLWDEDAITGTRHAGPSTRQDETVWYLEQMVHVPVISFGGQMAQGDSDAILRWTPEPRPAGSWLTANRLGLSPGCYRAATQLAPRRGERVGDKFLILGTYNMLSSGIYDAVTNTMHPTLWAVTRTRPANNANNAVTLADGRVMILGNGTPSTSCELFDPSTEAFELGPPMLEARSYPACVRLRDGRVLVMGGTDTPGHDYQSNTPSPVTATAELYDPATNSWSYAVNRTEENNGLATRGVLLDDGSVLVADGPRSSTTRTLQLFLPDKNRFWPGLSPTSTPADITPWPATPLGELREARLDHWCVRLGDGRVLLGNGFLVNGGLLQSAEIYDPVDRTFIPAGSTRGSGTRRSASLLPDGRVAIAGGADRSGNFLDAVDIYDPATTTWEVGAPLPIPLTSNKLLRLTSAP